MVMNAQAYNLIEELRAISKRAFGMALSVHRAPSLRTQWAGEAHLRTNKLQDLSKEMKRIDPAAHQQWFHTLSESFLDLRFVEEETDTVSLRLGDLMKWG
jgi:hypothetical protein